MDYSKFDKIGDDDSDDEPRQERTVNAVAAKMTPRGKDGRFKFEYDGRTIYEWDQSLDEVNIFVIPPPGIFRKDINISISFKHLTIGLIGAPPFIDEDTGGPVKPSESYWMLLDNEITINLQKMNKGERWDAALLGKINQSIDPFTMEEVKGKMMLERFQEEHPGFDFSNAVFNGNIPDARDFMGGIKYR